jgi:hypothetical protein
MLALTNIFLLFNCTQSFQRMLNTLKPHKKLIACVEKNITIVTCLGVPHV